MSDDYEGTKKNCDVKYYFDFLMSRRYQSIYFTLLYVERHKLVHNFFIIIMYISVYKNGIFISHTPSHYLKLKRIGPKEFCSTCRRYIALAHIPFGM